MASTVGHFPENIELSAVDISVLLAALQRIAGKKNVIYTPEELRVYECDGLSAYRQTPLLVVLPETTQQVSSILQLCHQKQVPVVARGAGTGLSGGALPLRNGVLLSLAKFNKILHIDAEARCARVQPGVANLAISTAVAEHNLYYAPDPSSQIACSIGGNVAENAGGVHCLKYGLTVHNILALEVITMDGQQRSIGSASLDSPGYDLMALFTGSEGLLGVIVEVTVKLLTKPACAQVLLAAFSKLEHAGSAVAKIIAAGIIPAGLEMMDHRAICAAEDFAHAGYPTDAAAILLCELDGGETEIADQISVVQKILQRAHASEIKVSANEQERQRFWAGRKAAFPAVGRIAPDYYCMDGTIPRKHLGKVLTRISELSETYGLPVANVFHAGDGNLHPLILYDANQDGQLDKAEQFGGEILELCVSVGGTITGEHGVGIEKINQMCVQFNGEELEQMHAIKNALDPAGLLNPGKAIPTLHRCAEFGAMHVHNGQLSFPELDRL